MNFCSQLASFGEKPKLNNNEQNNNVLTGGIIILHYNTFFTSIINIRYLYDSLIVLNHSGNQDIFQKMFDKPNKNKSITIETNNIGIFKFVFDFLLYCRKSRHF